MSELFPTEIRTLSIGIVQSLNGGVAAVMAKIYPNMKAAMGMAGLCYFYAATSLLLTVWAFFTISDNRCKTLVEIESAYRRGNGKAEEQKNVNVNPSYEEKV